MSSTSIILETTRLMVRQLEAGDVTTLSQILCDPEVMRYSMHGVISAEETREFITWCKDLYLNKGFGPWAVQLKENSELIGFAGISPLKLENDEIIEIGYRLNLGSWGQGYATEAVGSIMDYTFRVLGLEQIVAIIIPEHVASLNVAKKVGFSQYEIIRCGEMDVRKYVVTKDEWCSKTAS